MSYRPQSVDTDESTDRLMIERYRRMTPADRLQCVVDLNRLVEDLAIAGIRSRHPRADDREVFLRLAALRLGRDITRRVYDWDPAVEGW